MCNRDLGQRLAQFHGVHRFRVSHLLPAPLLGQRGF
jgi:hypothetical protein